MRRLVFAPLALGALAAPFATGCTTHQCDPSTVRYTGGEVLGSGDVVFYETSPLVTTGEPGEPWINVLGNETLVVEYPQEVRDRLEGYEFVSIEPAVGISDQPNDDAANLTTSPGQSALVHDISWPGNTGFTLMNTSCENDYYMRVVVTYVRTSDAASEPVDADALDAGVDARADGVDDATLE